MKIVQLVDSLEMGGTERMCVNIANGLTAAGIENALVVTRRPYSLSSRLNPTTTLFTGAKKNRWDFATFRSIYQFIKSEKPQVLHAHSTTLLWACLFKVLQPSIVLIWHDHYGNRKQAKDNFIHILLSVLINGIIAVNDDIAAWHVKFMAVKKGAVVCLPNFAKLSTIDVTGRTPHTIVMNANLLPVKDHFTLLKALSIVQTSFPSFHVYLIGKEVDPVYTTAVRNMINDLQLSHHVTVLGQVTAIESYLGKAAIGVLSSTSEGLPVSLLEYGLAKLAVVATDVGQCNKVLDNGALGWLVQPGQPQQLAECLLHVLKHPDRATERAHKLHEHIIQHYSEQTFMNSYQLLIQQLI